MKKKFLPFINRRFVHNVGAPGDFSASEHLGFLLKAEEKWKGGKFEDNLRPHADSLITQLERQTARLEELDNKDKDNKVTLTWIKSCGIETSDLNRATDICEINGTELESESQDYEYDLDQKITLSINDEKIRTGTYEREEQIAHLMMKADKELSEWWTKQYLIALKSFAGPNIPVISGDSAPMTWDAGNSTTNIPAADFDIKLVAKLVKMMQLNMVDGGFYIDRGGLFEVWLDAGYDTGNDNGKGDNARKAAIAMTFDMWNFGPTKAALTEEMFLVSNNAVAVKIYNRYSETPELVKGNIQQTRYRMKSNILPGVAWDVIYTLTCTAGADMHTWQFMTKGGIFLNPEPCPVTLGEDEYTPSGVYSFTKVP
jgi:hypothetical protein